MIRKTKHIAVIAYAEYYVDARIKFYINTLKGKGWNIDIYCLRDSYVQKMNNNKNIRFYFLGKKYQGSNPIIYVLSYVLFFIKVSMLINFELLRKKYKVIHVHNQPDLLVFCAIIPKLFGAKIILDLHDIMIALLQNKFGTSSNSLLFKLTKLQTKLSVRFADTLICADHSQKNYLLENGITHKNFHVYMNLPNDIYFSERSKIVHNGCVKVIYHGTISYRLGLDLAIRAIELANENVKMTLTIIGNGEQKDELLQYCQSKNILNKLIYFKQFLPIEVLGEEIQNYDIGIAPNRKSIQTERCGLSGKILEYMKLGIPVVIPRLKINELYFSDEMVCYYQPDDYADLSKQLVLLAKNEMIRQCKIENARGFFTERSYSKQADSYIELTENLVKN